MKDYDTITIQKKVGCGNLYVLFLENEGAFHRVFVKGNMAKTSPCGESWLSAIARLVTYSLRRSIWEGTTKRAIIKQLMYERCPAAIPNKEHIVSCSDAIGRAVLQYCEMKGIE